MTRSSAAAAVALITLAVTAPSALGLGGDPDGSYGYNGTGSTAPLGSNDSNRSLFTDTSGNAILVSNGSYSTFDAGGQYTGTANGSGITFQKVAAQDAQHRIVIAGSDVNGAFRVERYAGGALDTTFGSDGSVTIPAIDWRQPMRLATAPDGSLAVYSGGTVARLNADGSLDSAWNPTGPTPGLQSAPAQVTSMSFQSTGALLITCTDWSSNDPCLLRYAANDGSLDSTFGTAGHAAGFASETGDQLWLDDVLVAPDGSLYAGGGDATLGEPILARYTVDGTVDASWGDHGLVRDPDLVDYDSESHVMSMMFAPDGGIYAAIAWQRPLLIAKYTASGARDLSFGHAGTVAVPDPVGYNASLDNMAIAGDGGLLTTRMDTGQVRISKTTTAGVTPVAGLVANPTLNGVHLAWTNPATTSFAQVEVRVLDGTTAPTSATGGLAGTTSGATWDAVMPAGVDRSYTVFVKDFAGNYSTGTSVTLRGGHLGSLASSTRAYGVGRVISSKLTRTDGTALSGRTVGMYVRRHGTSTWARLASITTNTTGVATYTLKPSYNTDVQLRYAGGSGVLHTESNVAVEFVASSIAVSWVKTSLAYGTAASVSGTVGPNQRAQYVYLQRYYDRAWHTVAKAALSSTSRYAFRVKPTMRGYLNYRIYKPADIYRVASYSNATRIHAY